MLRKMIQIEPEGGHIPGQFLGGLLEGHEDPGLVKLGSASHEELHGEEGLAAPGCTADQGRTALRQPAACDFIKTAYPRRDFSS